MLDPNDIRLDGQVAVVTGGGGGIGKGIALGLAAFGCDVVIAEIDPEAAEVTAQEIRALGRRAVAAPTDVMEGEQIVAAIDRAVAEFGRLDILVNNVGGVRVLPFMEYSERSIGRQMEINLGSVFNATRAATKAMIAGGRGGSILNISSIEGQRAAPFYSVYAACKAGMISFTRTIACELAEHGIRVNCIAPDVIITEGANRASGGVLGPERTQARLTRIPLGRDGDLDDCAGAAVFLCSKLASYITGITLNVDGGSWAAGGWLKDGQGGWTLDGQPAPALA